MSKKFHRPKIFDSWILHNVVQNIFYLFFFGKHQGQNSVYVLKIVPGKSTQFLMTQKKIVFYPASNLIFMFMTLEYNYFLLILKIVSSFHQHELFEENIKNMHVGSKYVWYSKNFEI